MQNKIVLFALMLALLAGATILILEPNPHLFKAQTNPQICQNHSECPGYPYRYCQKSNSSYGVCKDCSVQRSQCIGGFLYDVYTCGQSTFHENAGGSRTPVSCDDGGGTIPPPGDGGGGCTPGASRRCSGNNVVSFDSCGNFERIVQTCSYPNICSQDSCVFGLRCERFTDVDGIEHDYLIDQYNNTKTDCSPNKECRCGSDAQGRETCKCIDKAAEPPLSSSTTYQCDSYTDINDVFHDFALTYFNGKLIKSEDCAASKKSCKCGRGASGSEICQCFGQPVVPPGGGGIGGGIGGGGGSSVKPKPGQVISHFITNCYSDDIYWYNSLYNLEDIKEECAKNSCEKGVCRDAQCSSELVCDGSTCAKDSADYALYCAPPPKAAGLPWYFWMLIIVIAITILLIAIVVIRRIAAERV